MIRVTKSFIGTVRLQTAANQIGFSQKSLLHDHPKNLVIFVKLGHLQSLQLSVLIYRMVQCWRQLNLLMCACVVRHDFVLQVRSKVGLCQTCRTLLRNAIG